MTYFFTFLLSLQMLCIEFFISCLVVCFVKANFEITFVEGVKVIDSMVLCVANCCWIKCFHFERAIKLTCCRVKQTYLWRFWYFSKTPSFPNCRCTKIRKEFRDHRGYYRNQDRIPRPFLLRQLPTAIQSGQCSKRIRGWTWTFRHRNSTCGSWRGHGRVFRSSDFQRWNQRNEWINHSKLLKCKRILPMIKPEFNFNKRYSEFDMFEFPAEASQQNQSRN